MTTRIRRVAAVAAWCAALALGTAGCGFHGIYSLPLPGAVATGPHTYAVTVELADVLDLVPYSAVKVNNATVGHVERIDLVHGTAWVRCRLQDTVRLPRNAVARVEQTSLLGEKFVEIEPPHDQTPTGRLRDGDTIALARTGTSATVEEVLGTLSLVLNGGGLARVQEITTQLNDALSGRESVARDTLRQLATFAAGLDAQRGDIVRALDGVDRLTATVRGQITSLTDAVDRMPAALGVLADDRARLTTMLGALDRLGSVAVHVVNSTRDDLLTNLRSLQPTLTKLAEAGEAIPKSLEAIITYPTANGVENAYFGDYGNLWLTVDVSKSSLLQNFSGRLPPLPSGGGQHGPPGTRPSLPTPPLPRLPGRGTSPLPVPSLPAVPRLSAFSQVTTQWVPGTSLDDLLLGVLR